MDVEGNQINPIRILMFPWLGYGHISPYFELAKKLITRGFIIYLCSTPATLKCIDNDIPEKLQSIKLVPLLLPEFPDLPRSLHTSKGLAPHLMPRLHEALSSSVNEFSNILTEIKPDLLFYDFLQPWAPLLAKERNIPAVHFCTSNSTEASLAMHYFADPGVEYPFPEIKPRQNNEHYDTNTTTQESSVRPYRREGSVRVVPVIERSCKIVLIKGFRDIESKYIDYVSSLVGKKFVPVGPLVHIDEEEDSECSDIFSWLDEKEKKSTVLVSFGSECYLSNDEIGAIAYGLELSKMNFIWIVRFPKWYSNDEESDQLSVEKTLPKGFVERVGDRGKVVKGWAPQSKILRHENIGGFVSHCGWNSVSESMYFGVPIIGVPMQYDQPVNARLVEEVGVGVEVLRDENGRLCGVTLAQVIKQVVVDDGGEVVRRKAADMSEKLKSKGDEEIDDVVKELVGLCNENSTNNN